MTRPLKGERYIEGCDPVLVAIIAQKLPYFTFYEASEFYAEVNDHLTKNEMALLGCNDRFWLLTALLNRVDAVHPWVYDRAREVEAEPDGHLDLWARYHYKSTLITFAGSIQELLIDPETRICIFANNKEIADPFLKQIKGELEENALLKEVYSDVLYQSPSKESPTWSMKEGITVKRRGNPRECTVEAHGLIDAMPVGKHFPILQYDDVVTEKNVTNPAQMQKAVERCELSFNIGIGEMTRKRFAGTRYSYADAYGHLIDKKIATPRLYPATDDGTMTGTPVFMTPSAWAKVLREQRSNVAAQMLQNPVAGKENTFYTKWLKPYYIRPIMMNVYIMCDPSMGKSASSDRTGLSVVGIDTTGNKYLLDGYCHRMKLSERWTRLLDLQKKWATMPGVQQIKVGYERYGLQTDLEYFQEKMREIKYFFEIIELNWVSDSSSQSKEKRVGRLEPDFRLGHFFLPWKVYYPDVDPQRKTSIARWSILDPENEEHRELIKAGAGDEFHYRPVHAPHSEESRAKAAAEHWRVMEPLRRLDEDGNIYDVTRVFFEEYRFFPFSPRKDFIDATSRIYDLEPMPATRFETVEVEDYADY